MTVPPLHRLPYREIWLIDFEFRRPEEPRSEVVCMVAFELRTRRWVQLWRDEFPAVPPFRIDQNVLFVAYAASAEMRCFLSLGWPMPANILDLYIEYRAHTNCDSRSRVLLELRRKGWFV